MFVVSNTARWYNAYDEQNGGSALIRAGVANAFLGLTNFASGNGVTTIDVNNQSGVTIGGQGAVLDLSGVTIEDGQAAILANQAYQKVTGTLAGDTFLVQSYGDTLNGGGGRDLFQVYNTSAWYNAYGESNGGAATIQAEVGSAFIGLTNFASGNGVTTIDVNNQSGVTIGGQGAVLDLSGVTIVNGPATILANQAYQAVTGTTAGDTFAVRSYGDTLNGGGGEDMFQVYNKSAWYNAYGELNGGTATIQAEVGSAFIGLTNFASGNGVTNIDVNNQSGVTIGGQGAVLDLSGVTIVNGPATILANQAYQTIIGTKANDTFSVQSYGDALKGGGLVDTFVVNNTSHWYDSYSDSSAGAAVIKAGVDDAFIGLTNFGPASGVTTIDLAGKTGVTIGGSGNALDLSNTMVVDNTLDGNTAKILANQAYQSVTGAMNGHDSFVISSYGETLTGSAAGFDTFQFASLQGGTTIKGFLAGNGEGHDVVDLSGIAAAPADFDDLLTDISQTASGAQIKIGSSTITLSGVSASALTASDFVLSGSPATPPSYNAIAVNTPYQIVNGTTGADLFTITTHGDAINTNGGDDLLVVDNTSASFNTYNASGSDTVKAGVDGAFIGITGAFNPAYIDLQGHTGVTVAGSGATLDLSKTRIVDSVGSATATILATQNYQTIVGTVASDTFQVQASGDALKGGGGNDTFVVDNASPSYNAYSDIGGAGLIRADVDDAFLGLTNFVNGNGVTTIDIAGHSGVDIAGSGTLDLSGDDHRRFGDHPLKSELPNDQGNERRRYVPGYGFRRQPERRGRKRHIHRRRQRPQL